MTAIKTDLAVAIYDLHNQVALKANKFMRVVHGDAQEIGRARELLKTSGLASFDHNGEPDAAAAA